MAYRCNCLFYHKQVLWTVFTMSSYLPGALGLVALVADAAAAEVRLTQMLYLALLTG